MRDRKDGRQIEVPRFFTAFRYSCQKASISSRQWDYF